MGEIGLITEDFIICGESFSEVHCVKVISFDFDGTTEIGDNP